MGRNADLYMYITAVSNTDHNRIQFKAKLTLGQKKKLSGYFSKICWNELGNLITDILIIP